MSSNVFHAILNTYRRYQNDIWSRHNGGSLSEDEAVAMLTNESVNTGISLYRHVFGIHGSGRVEPHLVDKTTEMALTLTQDTSIVGRHYMGSGTTFPNADKLIKEWINDNSNRESSINEDEDDDPDPNTTGRGLNGDPGFS